MRFVDTPKYVTRAKKRAAAKRVGAEARGQYGVENNHGAQIKRAIRRDFGSIDRAVEAMRSVERSENKARKGH